MLTNDLINLLYQCSESPEEHTLKLVTADMAEECGFISLANILRYLAQNQIVHIFTGSRCYGTPTEQSDWDWVVIADGCQRAHYVELADPKPKKRRKGKKVDYDYDKDDKIEIAHRFGPLNLIVVSDRDQWNAWEIGTMRCKLLKPTSTEQATEILDEEYHIQDDHYEDPAYEGDY